MIALLFVVLAGLALGAAMLGGWLPTAALAAMPGWPVLAVLLLFGVLIAGGVHIGAALAVLGFVAGFTLTDRPFWAFAGDALWSSGSNFVLVSVPLFVFMGEIMLRAGLSERLYRTLNLWIGRAPGGLLHANVAASGLFSAVAGSSIATAATIGSVALPYFEKTRYPAPLVLGSLAAGGALGNLIPPSITLVVYALMTDTSVGALYIAALGPALLVLALFTLVICWKSQRARLGLKASGEAVAWRERLTSLSGLLPVVSLGALVLGTLYAGWATPTESAAIGVVGALVLAALERRLDRALLSSALHATARTTSMVALILLGAHLLNLVLSSAGVPRRLSAFVSALPLEPWVLMLIIIGFYLALGTVMEGLSMIVTTIPFIFPVVQTLGYDPVWFGIVVTILVEVALISPPDGSVLYVLQGLRTPRGPIGDVFTGVMPFLFVYIVAVLLLLAFPMIALYLPSLR